MDGLLAVTAVPPSHNPTSLPVSKVMKLFSLLFAAIVGTAVLAPATADARPYHGERTRVTYERCGTPVYWAYAYAGRDYYGRPIYRWVVKYRGHRSHGGYHRGGYGHRDYGHRGYSHRGYGHRSRGGISFHWSR
jgi:hypothetical protein